MQGTHPLVDPNTKKRTGSIFGSKNPSSIPLIVTRWKAEKKPCLVGIDGGKELWPSRIRDKGKRATQRGKNEEGEKGTYLFRITQPRREGGKGIPKSSLADLQLLYFFLFLRDERGKGKFSFSSSIPIYKAQFCYSGLEKRKKSGD